QHSVPFAEGPTAPKSPGEGWAPVKSLAGAPAMRASIALPFLRRSARRSPVCGLSFHTVHRVAGRDDRPARACAVVGVALLRPVGADERDAEIAVHVRSDDGFVFTPNHPVYRLFLFLPP